MTVFSTVEGGVSALYVGYFGRAGDPAGARYWSDQLYKGVMTLPQIAASFSVQTEAVTRYPFLAGNRSDSTGIENFINGIFQDLLCRDADSGGLAYWAAQLHGRAGDAEALGAFIVDVISGAIGYDDATITNKVMVATYFTDAFAKSSLQWNADASLQAKTIVTETTNDLTSVTKGKAAADAYLLARSSTRISSPSSKL